MLPYTKEQAEGHRIVRKTDGEVVATTDTEALADAVLAYLTGHFHTCPPPQNYPCDTPIP